MRKRVLLSCASMLSVALANAQVKLSSVSEMNTKVSEATSAVVTMVQYIIGAVLAIALIFVVYSLATSSQRAKEYLIGWVIAVVVCLIAKGVIIGF